MARMAANAGCKPEVITAIKAIKCGICASHQPPQPPRPTQSAPAAPLQFGTHLYADVFFFHDAGGNTRACLGIVDSATWLHQACVLHHKDARQVTQAFHVLWFRPYGVPEHITTDADPCFGGMFSDCCQKMGIELRHIPAEAHHQLGRAERHNALLRLIVQRVVNQL
eukprot:6477906-Amphidinium_carterae.1